MHKFLFLLCTILVTISSCNTKLNDKEVINEVEKIQKKVQEIDSDSNYIKLKHSEKLLKGNEKLDSLKIENDYLIGSYFLQKGNQDSAVVNFQRAVDKIQDSAYSERHRDYFYQAWHVYYGKGKYGDCFAVSEKLKSLIDTTKVSHSLEHYYYYQELTYYKVPDFHKALFYNELRTNEIIKRGKQDDGIGIPGCLLQRSRIYFHGFNDKEPSLAILNQLAKDQKNFSKSIQSLINSDLGIYYFYEKEYDKTLSYYLKSLNILKENKDIVGYSYRLPNYYSNIAEVLVEMKEFDKAQKYLDSVKMTKLENIREGTLKIVLKSQLKLALLTNQDLNEGLKQLDTLFLHRDKIYEDKFNNELVALKKAHETQSILVAEKQTAQLKTLQLKSILLFLVIVFIALSFIAYLLYRYRSFRKKLEKWLIKKHSSKDSIQSLDMDTSQFITIPLPILNQILKSLEEFEIQNKFLSENINLRSLAKSFNTNYTYLSKVINIKKGKNFTEYINDLRIKYAHNELATNADLKKYTIKAIALECGFKSAESFSKHFHKKYGLYPSTYIKTSLPLPILSKNDK